MTEIKSIQNEKIKFLKKLQQKKTRRKEKLFLVENAKIVLDAFSSGIVFEELYLTENFLLKNKSFEKFLAQPNVFIINEKINTVFSALDTPAGIGAVYKIVEKELDFKNRILYLNEISDPGNLGTILRTALAFGWKNVVVDEKCVDLYNPKVIQAAKDAIFKLKIVADENLKIFKKCKKYFLIIASDLQATGKIKVAKKDKLCLVLGNETRGVAENILELADKKIKIEISKEIDSLNVAIAGAILMYQLK